MCFKTGTSILLIHEFLVSRILEQVKIIFASKFSTKISNNIYMYTDGVYRMERFDKPIRDPEEINCLYCFLYDKYGFTNILGYY